MDPIPIPIPIPILLVAPVMSLVTPGIFTQIEYKKNLESSTWEDKEYSETKELIYMQLTEMINTEAKYSSLKGWSCFRISFQTFRYELSREDLNEFLKRYESDYTISEWDGCGGPVWFFVFTPVQIQSL